MCMILIFYYRISVKKTLKTALFSIYLKLHIMNNRNSNYDVGKEKNT